MSSLGPQARRDRDPRLRHLEDRHPRPQEVPEGLQKGHGEGRLPHHRLRRSDPEQDGGLPDRSRTGPGRRDRRRARLQGWRSSGRPLHSRHRAGSPALSGGSRTRPAPGLQGPAQRRVAPHRDGTHRRFGRQPVRVRSRQRLRRAVSGQLLRPRCLPVGVRPSVRASSPRI